MSTVFSKELLLLRVLLVSARCREHPSPSPPGHVHGRVVCHDAMDLMTIYLKMYEPIV